MICGLLQLNCIHLEEKGSSRAPAWSNALGGGCVHGHRNRPLPSVSGAGGPTLPSKARVVSSA